MKKKVVITAVVLLVASFVSIASALQIDVDGDPSDWVPEASVATSPPKSTPLAQVGILRKFSSRMTKTISIGVLTPMHRLNGIYLQIK